MVSQLACCHAEEAPLTCFVGGDGELVAGVAVADGVFSHHADVVGGGGMEVDDGGLVELRGHVFGHLG